MARIEAVEKIFLWLLVISLMLYIVAFATTGWHMDRSQAKDLKVGLWDACHCDQAWDWEETSWFKASQAMTTIGLIFFSITAVMAIVFVQCHSLRHNYMMPAIILLGFLTVVFIVIGLSVFGVFINDTALTGNLGYSFVLAAVAGVGCFLAAFLAIIVWKEH